MKVLYVTDALAVYGGLERVLTDKMNHLATQYGYDVHLVTANQGAHPVPYPLHPAVVRHDLRVDFHLQYQYKGLARLRQMFLKQRCFMTQLRRVVRQVAPDVVVNMHYDYWSVAFCVGRTPLLIESHSMCYGSRYEGEGRLRRWQLALFRRLTRRATGVVALTRGDARDWQPFCRRVFVIPNVAHLNTTGRYSTLETKSVLFVGRFCRQKDVGLLLAVWDLVHALQPQWQLNIYGDGPFPLDGDALAAKNVCVHAATSDVMGCYLESSILLLTSLYEPFGLVLPEAMSCGLPVVAVDCPYGPADIITDGIDGFLVRSRQPSDIASRVAQLMSDAALRRRMGQAAIQSAQRYSARQVMPLWADLFEQMLSRSPYQSI